MNAAELFLPILVATVTIGTVLLLVADDRAVPRAGTAAVGSSANPGLLAAFGVIVLGLVAAFALSNAA